MRRRVQRVQVGERRVRPGFACHERQRRVHQATQFAQADGHAAPGGVCVTGLDLTYQVSNGSLKLGGEQVLLQMKLQHVEHAARFVPAGQRPGKQPEHLVVREGQLAFEQSR